MRGILFIAALLLGASFIDGAAFYICGRIMCPEYGLNVPDFWACYWAGIVVLVPFGIGAGIKAAAEA